MSDEAEERTERKMRCIAVSIVLMATVLINIGSEVVRAPPPPGTVYVDDDFDINTPGWGVDHFKTIQEGVDAVASDGSVKVYAGDYDENVLIGKNLGLEALNGSAVTTVGKNYIPAADTAALKIDPGYSVSISGFNITEIYNGWYCGIYGGSGAKIIATNNKFYDLFMSIKIVEGYLYADSNEFDVVSLSTGRPHGIFLVGGSTTSVIVNNTFDYHDVKGQGVRVDKTAIRLIANNTFTQGEEWNCPGCGEASSNIGISNMGLTTGYTFVRNNTITNGFWGVMSEGTNATVENNTMSGCRICISSTVWMAAPDDKLKYPSSLVAANNSLAFVGFGLQSANKWSYMKAYNNSITGLGAAYGRGVSVQPGGRMDLGPNNTISNTQLGVKTYGSYGGSFTNATNNTIFNTSEGFHSEGTDNVYHNLIYSNDEGIRIQGNSKRDISNNTIIGSTKRAGIWFLDSSDNEKVQCNNISQGYRGVWITGGSSNNIIRWNNISDNDIGVHLEPSASGSPDSNTIRMNNISFSSHGILVDQTVGTEVDGNDIANNYDSGIYLSASQYTNITHGNITNNYIGIDIQSSDNDLISDNSLLGNVLWAINATDYVDATGNYFGTNDESRIDKLVSENVNYSNPLSYRESGVTFTAGDRTISSDTEFTQGHIVNGSLTISPNVNITFTNKTGHNFIQVNGTFVIISNSVLKATYGNFTLLATNGSDSTLSNSWFERQMGIGIQTTNMTVANCTFINGTSGVVVNQGISNTIQDSDFISNSRYGIYLFGSSNNTIQDNFIALSPSGILAYDSTLDALSWNNISANDHGIKITHSSDASIHNNTVTNNYMGISVYVSTYISVNNNSIVGNVHLAIFVPTFSIGTNAQYNYFGTNDSEQIEKLCQGVDCSVAKDYQNPNFDYIDGNVSWTTPQNRAKGVIVRGNLTISTNVSFSSGLYQNFIQVNGRLEANSSSLEGNQGLFTILYLNKSAGGFGNSNLTAYRGVGVQSESDFITNGSSFVNGTYGVLFWRARNGNISNSAFVSNENWAIGLFHSDDNKVEAGQISNSSVGVYVYASTSNNISYNEINDNRQGIWLDSKRLSFDVMEPNPKSNQISSNEFYNNDVGVLISYSDGDSINLNIYSSNWTGTGVEISSRNAKDMTVSWNLFKDNEYGVLITDSTENEIDNNTFDRNLNSVDIDSSRVVLMCEGPFDCTPVSNPNNVVNANNISIEETSTFGIRVQDTHYNFIGNNTIYAVAGGSGIWIEDSDNNTIMNNSVTSTSTSRATHGIRLEYAGGNNLTENAIANYSYNFGVMGEKLWDFVQTIDTSNTVDDKKIYYWVDEDGNNSYYNSDGGYYAFVNSSRMKLENTSSEYNLQGFLLAFSNHIYLKNITATYTFYGVQIHRSNDSEVTDGNFSSSDTGSYLYYSDHITLENVSGSNDQNGIYMYNSDNNSVGNGSFSNNHHGLYFYYSDYNVISNVSATDAFGGVPRTGMNFEYSSYNLITNNSTISRNRPGILIQYSHYNTISSTNITENKGGGGIDMRYSVGNKIIRCYITGNYFGVYNQFSGSSTISNNTIVFNSIGIHIYTVSQNNLIANNWIANNTSNGLYMYAGSNTVILNNFTNNGGYAVKIQNKGGNSIHHNNMICNRADCWNGYQASDDYLAGIPSNQWDDTAVGNYWTWESWNANGGSPTTYWVYSWETMDIQDNFPQSSAFIQAGPQ